ncbi:hypothetical protein FFK22_024185 [Mycobacterium sp. KBS0706]|uniref:ATP-binding protein n=1 Tax=Mycobacterium sp. KBS0706 TaxID=2578109 RepID=UPI00110F7550|nr:winged helix-turn-helix domain-containing protein [Mycobacterium sp. KBS0706]TSD86128.1 hypothetical protein FFK22_024185 [Mycobacterium sp. KBS0706]
MPYHQGLQNAVRRDVVSFGPFRLSIARRLLERNDTPVPLRSRALDLLLVLIERANEVVTKDEIMARVWPGLTVSETTLRVQIAGLRRALGDGEQDARYIANVTGRGYCFVASLTHHTGMEPAAGSQPPSAAAELPPAPTRMVGRDDTVRNVSRNLATRRFLTIVGPGGVGKTTVAVAVARHMLEDVGGAVHFIDLGSLSDPSLVPSSIASTLGAPVGPDTTAASLLAFLRRRRMLLILDSCEHVIDAVASLTDRIRGAAPEIHLLATSREPLRVEGEQVHRLRPLDYPPEDPALTAADALRFPAVQLFVEHAVACGSRFEFSDEEAPVVGEICRRLDGIALAIQLAAGRVEAYSVRVIAVLLDSQFTLGWDGRRTAVPRHRTLSAMLDWSHNLLSAAERVVLRRLAVFSGYFSFGAALSVTAGFDIDGAQAANAVASLVAKSLVAACGGARSTRYRLLGTTRAYMLQKLVESGEEPAIISRHVLCHGEESEQIGANLRILRSRYWLLPGGRDCCRNSVPARCSAT